MLGHIAPAGTPIRMSDLSAGLRSVFQGASTISSLTQILAELGGVPYVWPVSSGRAAMLVILRAMKAARCDPTRDEVVIPGYTCYSVPAAIERAGLRPRLCDVDPVSLSLDTDMLRRIDLSRVLAVCSGNLYGIPNDLPEIESVCRDHGLFFLDDAAQALGAGIAGRPAGSFGDAGLFSFDKGKVISTIQGGAIVAREGTVAAALGLALPSLPPTQPIEAAQLYLQLMAFAALLHPLPYGLVRRLPGTGLGQTRYETRYPIARLSQLQAGVACSLLGRLPALADGRRARAAELDAATAGFTGVESIIVAPGATPAYGRFPLRVTPQEVRDEILAALVGVGIGATASYPRALIQVPEVARRLPAASRDTPGARAVASSIVTLPTHAYCPPRMAQRVHEVIDRVLYGRGAVRAGSSR